MQNLWGTFLAISFNKHNKKCFIAFVTFQYIKQKFP